MEIKTRPFKIALSGTLNCGKSTLLKDLQETSVNDPGTLFIEEQAAIFFDRFPINESDRNSLWVQQDIQNMVFCREQIALIGNPARLVCDRSVLDAVVYSEFGGDREGSRVLYERMIPWVQTYDRFLLPDPTGIVLVNNHIRPESDDTRWRIHDTFLDFFTRKGFPFEVISGSREERLAHVSNILNMVEV